jgi:hypothetical protein
MGNFPILLSVNCRKAQAFPEEVTDERSDKMSVRNVFAGFAGLLLIAMVAVQWTGPSVNAQDTTGDRLSALETQVADLESRVSSHGREIERLEDKIATLETGSQPSDESKSEGSDEPGSTGEGIELTGSGDSATQPVDIAAGAYTFAVTCSDGVIFTVDITPIGSDEFVISTLVGQPPFEGSEVLELEGGRYAFSVSCGGAWTLSLTPLV